MQLEQQNTAAAVPEDELSTIRMLNGLRGFPEIREVELVYRENERPFMWLRDTHPEGLQFLVAEPVYLFDQYKIELFDDDAADLGLSRPEDAIVLNILTATDTPAPQIYANQVGPVLINARSRTAKQVIIKNYQAYQARKALI